MKIKDFPMLRPFLASLALGLAGPCLAAESPAPGPAPTPAAAPVLDQKSGVLLDRVVAVVNDGVITESELEERIATVIARLRENKTQLPPEAVLRKQILDQLILNEVQLQRAARVGVKVDDEELGRALTNMAQSNGLTLTQLPEAMAQQGIDYALFRDSYRKQIVQDKLQERDVRRHIVITPRELDQFIEKIKRLPDPEAEYNTSHILLALPDNATQAQVEETTKLAQEIIERARTEDFSKLAVTYSNSPDALEGGELGWRKGQALPTIFQEPVADLKIGEVSKPLVVPGGVHLVRLNEKRSGEGDPVQEQAHARHILMKPNELQDDATVRLKLSNIRDRVLKGEDFAVFASSMSEDSGSAVNGGDLDWRGPGSFVPEFEKVLDSLAVNDVSPPFQTQFGWHIVQLLGRRKFDTTEEALRDRAYQQLKESRVEEETETWVRRLRDEAFVEISM